MIIGNPITVSFDNKLCLKHNDTNILAICEEKNKVLKTSDKELKTSDKELKTNNLILFDDNYTGILKSAKIDVSKKENTKNYDENTIIKYIIDNNITTIITGGDTLIKLILKYFKGKVLDVKINIVLFEFLSDKDYRLLLFNELDNYNDCIRSFILVGNNPKNLIYYRTMVTGLINKNFIETKDTSQEAYLKNIERRHNQFCISQNYLTNNNKSSVEFIDKYFTNINIIFFRKTEATYYTGHNLSTTPTTKKVKRC